MTRGVLVVRMLLAGLMLALLISSMATPVQAQAKKKAGEKPAAPKPEDITIETDDVELHCTYYPSDKGKDAVLVILVHDWESRRTELEPLAKYLQEEGKHAVLVPDLRGHGDSNVRKIAPGAPAKDITPEDLTDADLLKMASTDFVYIKNEMITRHNAGEFNIDTLTLVGVGVGSNVALHWAGVDWTQPNVAVRLGRDVKALVLVSPQAIFKRLRTPGPRGPLALPAVRAGLSIMTIAGVNDSKMQQEMSRIDNAIARYHPEPKQRQGEDDMDFRKRYRRTKAYYQREKETTLQGVELINAPNLNVAGEILQFINLRIVERLEEKDLPEWEGDRRKDPIPKIRP